MGHTSLSSDSITMIFTKIHSDHRQRWIVLDSRTQERGGGPMKCVLRLGTGGFFRDETLRGLTFRSYFVTSRRQDAPFTHHWVPHLSQAVALRRVCLPKLMIASRPLATLLRGGSCQQSIQLSKKCLQAFPSTSSLRGAFTGMLHMTS